MTGFLIASKAMASVASDAIAGPPAARSYRVQRGPGGALPWVQPHGGRGRVHDGVPGAGFWRRLVAATASLLPVEWLLCIRAAFGP